jgi:hypothetical protein
LVIRSAPVNPNAPVDSAADSNEKARTVVIRSAVTRCAVIQNVVILIEARVVILNVVIPSVVTQSAMGDFPKRAVLIVVRGVARGAVIQPAVSRSAATPCVQFAAYRCVANLAAMAVRDEERPKVLPNGAQDVVPDVRPALNEVQSVAGVAQVRDVFPFLARAPAQPQVVRHVLAPECCRHREHFVVYVQCLSDPDVRRAVDPVMPAFQDEARSRSALPVRDDLPRRLETFPCAEFPPC